MPHSTKIATCCYCSARTILKPTARDGHELACGSCGAPLHEMKWLKAPKPAEPAKPDKTKRAAFTLPSPKFPAFKPRKKRKRKKSLLYRVAEEAWDILEDIFD